MCRSFKSSNYDWQTEENLPIPIRFDRARNRPNSDGPIGLAHH